MGLRLRLYAVLATVVVTVAATFGWIVYRGLDATKHQDAHFEIFKILAQLVVVGVIGGFVTWVFSESSKQSDRDSQERDRDRAKKKELNEFRRAAIQRLVATTNVVRRAPLLIESHRSRKTYGEQARAILDARLDLSLLRHELASVDKEHGVPIGIELRKMEEFLDSFIDEWKEVYLSLPDTGEAAWSTLQRLPRLHDLLEADRAGSFQSQFLPAHQEAVNAIRGLILGAPEEQR